ncbi:MAG TPA: ABC transporter permease [Chthoniobacterales bacterium]
MILLKRFFWRLFAALGVLLGAITLTFIAINTASGDPALVILGGDEAAVSKQALDQVRMEYGLDRPLLDQYLRYMVRLAGGDMGESYRLHIPVTKAIAQQIGATIALTVPASITAVVLAIVIALLTARRSNWIRSLSSNSELVISSMPSFVVGILLLLVFSFQFHLLPASGSRDWQSLVLPTLAVALPISAVLAQVLRQELEDILEMPFILTARARGMRDASVRLLHALRHAMIPVITLSGFIFASLLGGTVVVETLFSRQGVGRLLADAVTNKDIPLVLGVTTLSAIIYVTVNLLVDIIYTFIDPRVKTTA